ncbi:MAG TPA: 50S ribosomal protein L21 [Patescibacteria group bacterium]|nr:50S ribosomal protein L21 [Patescibacteria group bacterium]
MVYVVATGGKQYVVGVGQNIKVEKIDSKVGDIIELDDLLHAGNKVKAKVLATAPGKKINILKFKPKTRYMKRLGHRQIMTTLEILGNTAPAKKEPPVRKVAPTVQNKAKKPVKPKKNVSSSKG